MSSPAPRPGRAASNGPDRLTAWNNARSTGARRCQTASRHLNRRSENCSGPRTAGRSPSARRGTTAPMPRRRRRTASESGLNGRERSPALALEANPERLLHRRPDGQQGWNVLPPPRRGPSRRGRRRPAATPSPWARSERPGARAPGRDTRRGPRQPCGQRRGASGHPPPEVVRILGQAEGLKSCRAAHAVGPHQDEVP